jgi:hypothetical protein
MEGIGILLLVLWYITLYVQIFLGHGTAYRYTKRGAGTAASPCSGGCSSSARPPWCPVWASTCGTKARTCRSPTPNGAGTDRDRHSSRTQTNGSGLPALGRLTSGSRGGTPTPGSREAVHPPVARKQPDWGARPHPHRGGVSFVQTRTTRTDGYPLATCASGGKSTAMASSPIRDGRVSGYKFIIKVAKQKLSVAAMLNK